MNVLLRQTDYFANQTPEAHVRRTHHQQQREMPVRATQGGEGSAGIELSEKLSAVERDAKELAVGDEKKMQ